jgi:hypothetical protein
MWERTLSTPRKVSGLKTESTELEVATARADEVDLLGADLGVGGLTAHFELSLLAHGLLLTTGKTALASGVAGNAYRKKSPSSHKPLNTSKEREYIAVLLILCVYTTKQTNFGCVPILI